MQSFTQIAKIFPAPESRKLHPFGRLWLPLAMLTVSACQPLESLESLASSAGASLTASAPRGYERLLSDTDYGFAYVTAPDPVRFGSRSERYELRDGDCSDSDCPNGRSRTEVRQTSRGLPIERETWIGWSFYNASVPAYPRASTLKTVFGQWKQGGAAPAAIRIQQIGRGEADWANCDRAICTRPATNSADVVLDLEAVANARGWGPAQNNGYVCPLFSMQAVQGRWIDIVLHTNFAAGSDGFVNAWVDGEQVCRYRGPVIADPATGRHIDHRRGIFINFSERWNRTRAGQAKPTLIAYFDEYRTGRTREDVDTRLRAETNQRATD